MEISKCPFCTSEAIYEIFIDRMFRCADCHKDIWIGHTKPSDVNAVSDVVISPQTNFIPKEDAEYDSM